MSGPERSLKLLQFLVKMVPSAVASDPVSAGAAVLETYLEHRAEKEKERKKASFEQVASRVGGIEPGYDETQTAILQPLLFRALDKHAEAPFEDTKVAIEAVLAGVWRGKISLEEGDSTLVLLDRLSNLEIRLLSAAGTSETEWQAVRQQNLHQSPQNGLSCAVMILGGEISDDNKRDPVRMAAESLERYLLADRGYAESLDRAGAINDCTYRLRKLTPRGRRLSDLIRDYGRSIETHRPPQAY